MRRMIVSAALLFVFAVCASAQQPNVVPIDAPGVLDKPGATYVLTKDVTAPRTAFCVKGDGITLDLGGHTVTYGTERGVDRCSGVFLRPTGGEADFAGVPKEGFGGGNRFTLKNGRIVQGPQPKAAPGALTFGDLGRLEKDTTPADQRAGRSCFAVYVRGCRGLEIAGVTTDVNSRDTDNLYLRDCGDVNLHHNRCTSTVTEVTDRHWPGTGIITVDGIGGPIVVAYNEVVGGAQSGIRASGGGETGHLVQFHHNVIRHTSHTTNGYAIGAHAPNMRIYANVIKSEGRGVHLGGNAIDLYNNIVEPRERPSPEYPRTRTHGIKLEGCTRAQVHHNFCRVVADAGFGDADPLDFDCPAWSQNHVWKNTIIALRTTNEFWATSVNIINSELPHGAIVNDNRFVTNQYHVRADWGGMRGFLFENNRWEVVGDAKDYAFFWLEQSSAARTFDMVFRDSTLVPPADLQKARFLYGPQYTRANVDITVESSVTVRAADPAGKPVAGCQVTAAQGEAYVGSAITGGDGAGRIALVDYRIIGGPQGPIEKRGPYRIVAKSGAAEPVSVDVDAKAAAELTVTIVDPKRKVYVYAGIDRRYATGETATIEAKAAVAGDASAKPEITWRQLKGPAPLAIPAPNALKNDIVLPQAGEWTLEVEAKSGGESAKDTVNIRADANITPKAVATAPATAKVNTIVQLDASKSTEPRRFPPDAIRYEWKQVGGPETNLSSVELTDPIFYPEKPGTYEFELRVSSPLRTSAPARCAVVVAE